MTYSSVPNSRTCTLNFFEEKIHPVRPYSGPVRLLILTTGKFQTFLWEVLSQVERLHSPKD